MFKLILIKIKNASVVIQKYLFFGCHSGLDLACLVLATGESSILSWIPAFETVSQLAYQGKMSC